MTRLLTPNKQKALEEWNDKVKNPDIALKEAKGFTKYFVPVFDPDENLRRLAREVIPKVTITNEKLNESDQELIQTIGYNQGLDNGFPVLETIDKRYRGTILSFRNELIKEYGCTSYTEKALIDLMVGAYARNLTISNRLTGTATMGSTTPNLNQYMAVMSKEIDRANRQFVSALETLKQIKQPELRVNVKTKNAFISQNQQFNNNQPPHEINEPK